jgi:adenylate cyclase
MESFDGPLAWLETANGERLPLDGASSLGRDPAQNRYGFNHAKVSRRHALIHAQEGGEFWILDLGSTNGTYVDGDRLTSPRRLTSGDRLQLGSTTQGIDLVFGQDLEAMAKSTESAMMKTIVDTREEERWLLVADLTGFSHLSKTIPATELALRVGHWLNDTTALVQTRGGRINKYTGDGFLAFWRDRPGSAAQVATGLREFRELQKTSDLAFRIVLHRGKVAVGGAPTLGEESMLSDDLSFTFRLEKLAGTLQKPILLSARAAAGLSGAIEMEPLAGAFEMKGFPPVEGLVEVPVHPSPAA